MGTTGAPLNLTWPAEGATDWDTNYVNTNWGKVNTAIAALQAGGSAGPAGPTGPSGAVGMIYTGPWSSLVSYVPTDAVLFNGSTYIATSPNVNAEPDTHPSSWAILAAAGQPGAAGATGPAGPPGSGAGVTFPITLAEGGTGVAASNQAQARAGLLAAASGTNTDITALEGVPGIQITSGNIALSGGGGNADLTAQSLSIGSILPPAGSTQITIGGSSPVFGGGGEADSIALLGAVTAGSTGLGVVPGLSVQGGISTDSLLVTASVPTPTVAGQVGFGAEIANAAGAPNGSYWVISIGGTTMKIALLAN